MRFCRTVAQTLLENSIHEVLMTLKTQRLSASGALRLAVAASVELINNPLIASAACRQCKL